MGFWSGLAKIGLGIAAPFTGGATAAAIPFVDKIAGIAGPLASGIAAGQQKGRESENTQASDAADFKLRESNLNEDNQISRADLDLRRRGDAREGQSDSYKKALQSALQMNMKDFEIDPASLPAGVKLLKTSGGMRPSAYGAEGKAAAQEMNRQAMAKLLAGENFDALPELERAQPAEMKKPGWLENVAGGVATGANAYNSYQAGQEQQSMQERLMAAIEASKPQGGGMPVDPKLTLKKPPMPLPTAPPMTQNPYGNVPEMNR